MRAAYGFSGREGLQMRLAGSEGKRCGDEGLQVALAGEQRAANRVVTRSQGRGIGILSGGAAGEREAGGAC